LDLQLSDDVAEAAATVQEQELEPQFRPALILSTDEEEAR
jgi:hypothetical protein